VLCIVAIAVKLDGEKVAHNGCKASLHLYVAFLQIHWYRQDHFLKRHAARYSGSTTARRAKLSSSRLSMRRYGRAPVNHF
jgi:hypothetical protein